MENNWSNLGVVETIFEEESDDLASLSSLSSPSTPLHSSIDAWTIATGRKPDVKIHVQGICFHLHKEPLITQSNYLKRHLTKPLTDFTLSPALKITADTFRQVAEFCYNGNITLTPLNLASLRTASELLEMNNTNGDRESLCQRTEYYLCMVVCFNRDLACCVLRSSLSLLPEAEECAFLPSRCVEALFNLDDDDDDHDGGDCGGIVGCAEELKRVKFEEFRVIVESMQRRFDRTHDLLYRLVDLYFLVYDGSKISEEQKTQICSCIDCSILSSPLLMHAVQNPRMPLRFIVQAMLIEQLNTHRTLFATLKPKPQPNEEGPSTLGAILERDAALRQVAQLRAALETTSSRIETLEDELTRMKQALVLTTDKQTSNQASSLLLLEQESGGRSSSCRFATPGGSSRVERGERGSVSASMMRFRGGKDIVALSSPASSNHLKKKQQSDRSPKAKAVKRNLGQRLMHGLKSAFGVSNTDSKLRHGEEVRDGSVVSIDHDGFRAMLNGLTNGDLRDK